MEETLKLAKEISKEHDKFTIIILGIIVIMYLIVNLMIPIILTFFNRKSEIKKIRSERKLDCAENVIKQLRLLSSSLSIIDENNINNGKEKINELRAYIKANDFLLNKGLSELSNDVLDYYSVVLISPEKRDATKEQNFFIDMKKEYEKIL